MTNQTYPLVALRLSHVKALVPLGRSSIYAGMKNGTFPKSIKLGERAVGWIESEVNDWLSSRIKASRLEVAA